MLILSQNMARVPNKATTKPYNFIRNLHNMRIKYQEGQGQNLASEALGQFVQVDTDLCKDTQENKNASDDSANK